MRQLGDLLVWASLMAMLAAVVYLTPRVAQYVSAESRPAQPAPIHDIAMHMPIHLRVSR